MESLLEITHQLRMRGYDLGPFLPEDESELYEIFRRVVDSGCQFAYESNSVEEFHRQFFSSGSRVYVCRSSNEVIGGFYLKANFSGSSSHIANAAYMVKEIYQGQGIGTLLIKASLHIAKELGFQAMQFNMVLSQNMGAIKLYHKLGFHIIGTIPQAVCNPNGSYQDGYVMYTQIT